MFGKVMVAVKPTFCTPVARLYVYGCAGTTAVSEGAVNTTLFARADARALLAFCWAVCAGVKVVAGDVGLTVTAAIAPEVRESTATRLVPVTVSGTVDV